MGSTAKGRVVSILFGILVAWEMFGLGIAGFAKFGEAELWTRLFVGWGYPGWFTHVVGAAELLGAFALLVPRLASYAATMLIVIMLGALATVLIHDSQLGPLAPILHIVGLSIIARVRWSRRWLPGS